MSRVILYMAVSLDGYVADKKGSISWLDQFHGPWEDYGYNEFIQSIGVTITGSKTYQQMLMLDRWPYPDTLNYVVTSKQHSQPRDGFVQFYSGDLVRLVADARNRTDKDIFLTGGANMVQQFYRRKLIDEIKLFVVPLVLGGGTTLFAEAELVTSAELVAVQPFSTGIVELNYLFNYRQNLA